MKVPKFRQAALFSFLCTFACSASGATGPDYAGLARQLLQVRDILYSQPIATALRRVMGGNAFMAARAMLDQAREPFMEEGGLVIGVTCVPGAADKCFRIALGNKAQIYVAVQESDITTFYGKPPSQVFPEAFSAERADAATELVCDGGPSFELLYKDEPTDSSTGETVVMVARSQEKYVAMRRTSGIPGSPIIFGNRNGYRLLWYTEDRPYQLVGPGRPVRSCQYD